MMPHPSALAMTNDAFEREIAAMIVSTLNLEVDADQIEAMSPLYGEGLGIDSIDILEIALVVSKRYGIQMKADSEDNFHIFASLHSLAAYIAKHKTT